MVLSKKQAVDLFRMYCNFDGEKPEDAIKNMRDRVLDQVPEQDPEKNLSEQNPPTDFWMWFYHWLQQQGFTLTWDEGASEMIAKLQFGDAPLGLSIRFPGRRGFWPLEAYTSETLPWNFGTGSPAEEDVWEYGGDIRRHQNLRELVEEVERVAGMV